MYFIIKIMFGLILSVLSIMLIIDRKKKLKTYDSYLYNAYYTMSPKEKKKKLNSVKADIIIYSIYAIYGFFIMIFDADFFIYTILIAIVLYAMYIDSKI